MCGCVCTFFVNVCVDHPVVRKFLTKFEKKDEGKEKENPFPNDDNVATTGQDCVSFRLTQKKA